MKKTAYVQIYENRISILRTDDGQTSEQFGKFSAGRLAIGDFDLALRLLKSGINELDLNPLLLFPPRIILHQIHFGDSRLSQVEVRILHELGALSGGAPVHVWQGDLLTPEAIATTNFSEK